MREPAPLLLSFPLPLDIYLLDFHLAAFRICLNALLQAAARQKENERLIAERRKQEERERRKQRLDAGFAEVSNTLNVYV